MINDRYKILKKLDSGGMGDVYKILDTQTNTHLALKSSSDKYIKNEFLTLSKLHHPNIIKVYDFGVMDYNDPAVVSVTGSKYPKKYYFTMEYIKGDNFLNLFKDKLPTTSTEYKLLYSIILQICNALKFIHFHKLIHCDIKPSNILIQSPKKRQPRAVITDFGLIEKKAAQKLKGTLQYIAPEVLKGDKIDQGADLFSLGVTIYQILSHYLPFQGDSAITLIKQHTKGKIKPPKDLNPKIPAELNDLILNLLQPKPRRKPDSVVHLQKIIHRISGESESTDVFTSPLIGRQKELSLLKTIFKEVKTGKGKVIFIHGENGIGKTRLLQEFKPYAQTNRASIKEFESGKDILKTLSNIIEQKPNKGSELNLFEKIVRRILNQARQSPLFLVFEDLQLQKKTSINLIEYLIRSIESSPILLTITSSNPKLINKNIQSIKYFEHIQLKPLNPSDTTNLVRSMLLTEDKIDDIGSLIHTHTEGNPFLITTFTRNLIENKILDKTNQRWTLSKDKLKTYKLPEDIKDFISSALKGLNKEELDLLKMASLLKSYFILKILKELTIVKPNNLFSLQKKGLIVENSAGNFSFTHQMVSSVIEKNTSISERTVFHKKIARVLENYFKQDLERIAPELTYHYIQANETNKAYKYALVSGERAKNSSANSEAVEYLELALSLSDKLDRKIKKLTLHENLGDLYYTLSKYKNALTKYESAISLASGDSSVRIYRKIGMIYRDQQNYDMALNYFQKGLEIQSKSVSHRILLQSDIGWIYMCLNDFEKSHYYSKKAIKTAQKYNERFCLSYVYSTLGAVYLQKGDYQKAGQYYRKTLKISKEMHNDDIIRSSSYNLGQILWKTGNPNKARELYKKSLKIAERMGNASRTALCHKSLGILAQEQGNSDTALKHYTSAITIFKRIGDKRRIATVHMALGILYQERSELDNAINSYKSALLLSQDIKDMPLIARIYSNLGNLYKETGILSMAIKNLKKALKIKKDISDLKDIAFTLHNIGTVYMLLGEMDEASKLLLESFRLHKEQKSKKGMAEVCPTLAEYYLHKGDVSSAEDYCMKGIRLCKEINDYLHLGTIQRVLGSIYSRKGKIDMALTFYSESIQTLKNLKAEHELGKTLLSSGEEIFSIREKIGRKFWWEGLLDQTLTRLKRAEQIFKNLNAKADLERVNSLISKLEKYSPLLLEPIPGEDKRLKALYRMSQIVNSTIEIKGLLEKILDLTIEIMEAERGFILLREGKELKVKIARNMDKQSISDMSDFSKTIVENVEIKGERIITANAQKEPRFKERKSIAKFKLLSILCVPFRIKERVVGAIYIDDRRKKNAFTSEDLEFLRAFCDQAAVALENANLIEELKNANKLLEIENIDMKDQIVQLRTSVEERYSFGSLIGKSKPMQKVYNDLDKIIKYHSPVIIEGETGTGKELIVNIIHYNGPRKNMNFIIVNSSAIPDTLLESELFGHVKGAFTGAIKDKKGLFEIADSGTIFLDEIADLSQELQVKLLRVLQNGEIRRVGDTKNKRVNVRVIVATNKDLKRQVEEGKFREDLYYRLNVMSIKIPPLRERKEDIPLLATHILHKFRKKLNRNVIGFTSDSLYSLINYHWPGNVRELENVIERAIIMADGKKITEKDLPKSLTQKESKEDKKTVLSYTLDDMEKRLIKDVLKLVNDNKKKAINLLGISRPTLYKKLKKYGL